MYFSCSLTPKAFIFISVRVIYRQETTKSDSKIEVCFDNGIVQNLRAS